MKVTTFFLFILIFFSAIDCFANDSRSVDALVSEATKLMLSNEREWQVLLLYKEPLFRGNRSLVDDERFFLSENGKYDPEAELNATISAIFDNSTLYETDNTHPICRFPARKDFIVKALDIDNSSLPKVNCTLLNQFIKDIDGDSITLVFPFLYIENPMSIFGHTLLRINNKRNEPLIGLGVTYAAETDGSNIFSMFFKGFTGGFKGQFSIKRYYATIFEYNNIDNRDIWEYDLNLSPYETSRVIKHLWEMQDMKIDYFFLDENCSYHLLLLLENARPELRLATSWLWEVPSDSVRIVIENNLVKDIKFRASHIKELESISDSLPKSAIDISKEVANGLLAISAITASDFPDRIKASMLDYANEILKYNTFLSEIDNESLERYKKLTINILAARSKYKVKPEYYVDRPISPDKGHKPSMVAATVGAIDNKVYTDITLRGAFHSLTDIDNGFVPASKIILLEGTVGYNYMENLFLFKDVTLIGVQANIPLTKLSKKPSFKFEIGGKNRFFSNYNNYFTPYITGGVGITFKILDSTHFYLLADAEVAFGKPYTNNIGVGFGGLSGFASSFKYGKVFIEANYKVYPFTRTVGQFASAGVGYTFPISQNNAITLRFDRTYSWGPYKSDLALKYSLFF